ncbi:hypothetical protein MFLAVUS_002829 [Mucor flavus]|uniref:Zinc-hook domain-containing protein n=1 Tax=Mucor flavus TaxID=439312 RepID=A0ABP9YRE2_9FUNG
MSSIEGMAIIGIRSFSPEEVNYIKFYSPLTLIVGENGCGKTTIIEALKYACTGELPPNSRNGAFVNDPRLSGKTEVKGQIKLKFINVQGQVMVCTRSLGVTLRKTTLSQRTIDSSLLRTYSISSRCADMDAELPLHLGVPKAILENVVFCHQEDSNWPFAEPGTLKKKFDDIFSAKQYQVISESMKDLIKQRNTIISNNNIRLEGLKSDTEKAKRIRTNVVQVSQQAAAKSETLQSLEENIERVQQEYARLNDTFRDINLTGDQIQQILNKRDFYQSTLNSLQDHITPRPESTEELKRMLQAYQASDNSSQREKSVLVNEKSQLERKLRKARDDLVQKHSIMGRLEAAHEEHERQINARAELIQSINDQYNYKLPTQEGERSAAVLRKGIKAKTLRAEQLKKDAVFRQNALSDELQVLKSRLMSIQENKKHLISRIEQEKAQISALERKVETYQVSHDEIDDLKHKIEEYKRKLDQINVNSDRSNNPELIKKEQELKELDEKVCALNEELSTLSKEGDIRAKLSLQRTDKESKEAAMLRLYHGCIDDVEKLIGEKPEVDRIEQVIYDYKTDKQNQLRELIEQRNKAQRELSSIDGKLNMVRQNLAGRKREASRYEAMCQQVCRDRNLPDELRVTETKIEELKDRMCNLSAVDSIYGKYIEGTAEAKCCPLCCRGFNDNTELTEFAGKLEEKKKRFPSLKTQIEASLVNTKRRLSKLKSVQGEWIKLEQLRKDISGIEETVNQLEAERKVAAEKVEVTSTEQRDVDRCKIKADNIFTIVGNISRIRRETIVVADEISMVESELQFSGSTRTIPDCQKDLEKISDQSKIVRRDIKRIYADIENTRRQASSIDTTIRQHEKQLSTLEHKLDFKVGLNFQLEELNEQLVEHTNECKAIELDVAPLNQKVTDATRAYELEMQSWKSTEETSNKEEHEMTRLAERIEECNNNIARIKASFVSSKFDQVEQDIKSLESFTKTAAEQIAKLDDRLSVIEKDEADRRGTERDLQDQIRYRQTEIDLKQCDEDLAVLEEKQGEMDIRRLKQDIDRIKSEESVLIDKRGSVKGELVQMKDQTQRYENELRSHYSNVDSDYAKLFVETKTLELAIADVKKFNATLSESVMRYHALKMDDLNKIIKDLWFKTYKGGDIDYIAIRADTESLAKNRSFNYRVVMYQNENELDMRGRCSAGQKVLASIIIRLALAETFCVKCGFFTLDEPTTNLDIQNVKSLAENLRLIIESKRDQPNFQFVIITHDENFVSYLGGSDLFEKYFKVSKQNGTNSIIHVEGEGAAPLE